MSAHKPTSVVIVMDPKALPMGCDPAAWLRRPPAGHQLTALPTDATTPPKDVLAELEALHPDFVIFMGLSASDALMAARWHGWRCILVIAAGDVPRKIGDWRDPSVSAPFYAQFRVIVGDGCALRVAAEFGFDWTVNYLASDFQQIDLRHVLVLAAKVRESVLPPPQGGSTHATIQEELEIWKNFSAGNRDAESDGVRARYLRMDARRGTAGGDDAVDASRAVPGRGGLAKKPPRVLFVSHDLTKTGAPTALLWALRGMKKLATPIEPWVLGIGDGPMEEIFASEVGKSHFLKAHFHDDSPRYRDILETIDRVDPDAVFLNATPLYTYVPLMRWKGIPTIWWSHDGINVARRDGHLFSNRTLEAMTSYALQCCDRVLTASNDTVRELETFCPAIKGTVGMVPYGFDIDAVLAEGSRLRSMRDEMRRELGVPADGVLFACVGSLERRKNQKRLVEAFQRALAALPAVERGKHHLAIVGRLHPDGDGPDSFHAEILGCITPEFAGQIHIDGPQPSGFPIMVAADSHVLVSTNECSPLVNIESMLLGTFVISSRVHGIPEVVIDGVRGRLVEPEDSADIERKLAWFIETRRTEPGAIDLMKERAREYATAHHGFATTGGIVARELERILGTEPRAKTRLTGRKANEYVEAQLMQRWAYLKFDVTSTCWTVRGYCHHAYDPHVPSPPRARKLRRA